MNVNQSQAIDTPLTSTVRFVNHKIIRRRIFRMEIYRKVGQTKFIKDGFKGLVTLHDSGKIAGSEDHKELFNGLSYEMVGGYRSITKPTAKDMCAIMDALFDFKRS